VRWRKLGLVYVPSGDAEWARTHAYLPTAHVRDDGRVRIYFAALDVAKRGRIGYVDVAAEDPMRIVGQSAGPVLALGDRGAFDESGVNASCLVAVEGALRLYYLGWQLGKHVPYNIFLGLAESRDGGETFERVSRAPVLERTDEEPFFRSAATVLRTAAGYRAWYVSTRAWRGEAESLYPEYVIRTATSPDGVSWKAEQGIAIDFQSPDEYGFGRPWVIRDSACFRMWYSIRSRREPYRIGYAESVDGVTWDRRDGEVGIARSESGWDSEMICFANVIDVGEKRYMFYNGNHHGATGFGLAVLDG
jgi:hypothetical protein